MAAIIMGALLWLMIKGLRAAARAARRLTGPRPRPGGKRWTSAELEALQAQRDELQAAIDYCSDLLADEESPEKSLRWLERRARLRGLLAQTEKRIKSI